MCRRNQIWGCLLIALGLGILLGCWLDAALLCCCVGIGAIAGGILFAQKK